MKKLFITLFISVLALGSASAQGEFKVGVEAGAGLSMRSDHETCPSYNFGIIGEYHFNKDWMLDGSLKLSSRNSKYQIAPGDNKVECDPHYLELPIHVAKKFNVSDNTTLFVGAGPMIGYGLFGNTKARMSGIINGEKVTEVRTEKYFDTHLNLEHGFSIKAGVDIKKGYRLSVGYNMVNHGGHSSNSSHNLSLNLGYIF